MRYRLSVPVVLLILAACASAGAKGSTPKLDRNVITSDEIARSSEHSALNLIRSLRPGMLNQRGNTSLGRGWTMNASHDLALII